MSDTFEELATKVRDWADARQILDNSTAEAQLHKLDEERRETLHALDMRKSVGTPHAITHWDEEVVDGIADMLICIINAAAIAGIDPVTALAAGYDEIKSRRGYLDERGIFIKEDEDNGKN